MKLIYVAGSFRAKTAWEIEQNVRRAEETGAYVVKYGAYPVIPHANTRHFHGSAPDAFFIDGTLELMRRCDAVMLVQRDLTINRSEGTKGEVAEARRLGLPVLYTVHALAEWMQAQKEAA